MRLLLRGRSLSVFPTTGSNAPTDPNLLCRLKWMRKNEEVRGTLLGSCV
ncbi:MAG: hypothetical protein ACREPC_01825 [Stenotrophomonas sp.]